VLKTISVDIRSHRKSPTSKLCGWRRRSSGCNYMRKQMLYVPVTVQLP
jgi:hypothetical protein